MKLKFLTYNLWYSKKWKEEIEFLKKQDTDIITLQEVTQHHPKYNLKNIDVISKIEERLSKYELYYAPIQYKVVKDKPVTFGNAILSKFPIVSKKAHYYLKPLDWTDDYTRQSRNLTEVKIKVNSKDLYIFTAHLTYWSEFKDSPLKIREAKKIRKIIKEKDRFIFAGDFNTPPESKVIEIFNQLGERVDKNNLPTWTKHPFSYKEFSEDKLRWKLDYIYYKGVSSKSFKRPDIDYSDHLPLITEFKA